MIEILGVKIDNLSKEKILKKIESFLVSSDFHQIATVNPEFILKAQKNPKFREVLNGCDLSVADGFGIKCAFWRNFKNLNCRMAGVDLAERILKIAENRGLGVFLACRKDGLSSFQETKQALLEKYPGLKIVGKDMLISAADAKEIAAVAPLPRNDILICNFGAPEQEIFIKNQKNGIIKLGIGVGGAFDFWTGKIKRAPKLMRKIGLEWFWRFFQEPRYRMKRVLRAVIIFPIRVIFKK